ncbi:hypothetical protein D3C85_1214580 [compost metagenome]
MRIGRLDLHDGRAARLLRHHLLLLGGLQRAGLLRLHAQALHRVHHVIGLGEKGIAHRVYPLRLAAHHVHHGWERDERLHARVPLLVGHRLGRRVAGETGVGLRPLRRRGHIGRVGRRHQHLRQQRIGIERHGCQQLVEMRIVELGLRPGGPAAEQQHPSTAPRQNTSQPVHIGSHNDG